MGVEIKSSVRLVVLSLLLGSAAQAQTALPVFVEFQFRNSVTNPAIVASEPKVSDALAKRLASVLRIWSFRPAGANDFPRLHVWLEKHSGWDIRMDFVPDKNQTAKPDKAWECVLFETGETDRRFALGGLPPSEQLQAEIEKAFGERMLKNQREAILGVLKKFAPLGRQVVSDPTAKSPTAVLALSWETYRDLGQSTFRIYYHKGQDTVILQSRATGRAHPYPGTTPTWNALAVRHEKWGSDNISRHLGELRQLQPLFFFLDEFIDAVIVGENEVAPIR